MAQPAAVPSHQPLVLGRYRQLRILGSGGSGIVWLARDERSGLLVALKIVPREGTNGSRAEREAAAAARLRHERCLRVYALARDEDHVYIASEYVQGRTLRQIMRAGELDDRKAIEAGAQILDGLAHAHSRGIVHRDVKPANVLVADAGGISVKLLDFGLALMREEQALTEAGNIPGTLAYISPERLRGETAGSAADVWAVGVLLWEALAGSHPFWGGTLLDTARNIREGAPSLASERPDLPTAIVRLVDRALATDPRKRPPAAALATALRRAASASRRERPTARRSRRMAALRLTPPPVRPERLAPAAAAAVGALWSASALPFYPAGWAAGIAVLAGALAVASPRAGLALALAVPILPLGNHALALAAVYGVVALAWLAASWREPATGLAFVAGPLLAPLGLLGLVPLLALRLRSSARRALQAGAAVLTASLVASIDRVGRLGVSGSDEPLDATAAVWRALAAHGWLGIEAAVLAAAAAVLPAVRARGRAAAAGYGAAVLSLVLVLAPDVPVVPIVLTTVFTCVLVAAEPELRRALCDRRIRWPKPRRRPRPVDHDAETATLVRGAVAVPVE
jgi:serine/threonine-protein kinase